MLSIEGVRACCTDNTLVLTEHLLTRMRQRHIRLDDIKYAIENGEIIEQYPADYPFPSCLIRKSGLIPRGLPRLKTNYNMRVFGIKPDGIINFLSNEAPVKSCNAFRILRGCANEVGERGELH